MLPAMSTAPWQVTVNDDRSLNRHIRDVGSRSVSELRWWSRRLGNAACAEAACHPRWRFSPSSAPDTSNLWRLMLADERQSQTSPRPGDLDELIAALSAADSGA